MTLNTVKEALVWVAGQDCIHFARSGVQHRTLGKLKGGQLPLEARIDLHRLTAGEALAEVDEFIMRCQQQGLRVVLIIHGKGHFSQDEKPVIKNLLNKRLRQQKAVLAFHSAKPRHGGTGAVYVLLKSQRGIHE